MQALEGLRSRARAEAISIGTGRADRRRAAGLYFLMANDMKDLARQHGLYNHSYISVRT